MRRIAVLVGALALLGSMLAAPALAKPNASPHFITGTSALNGYTGGNGDLYLHWQVAGLGNGGHAYVVVKGKADVTVNCRKNNGSMFQVKTKQVPVNEHDVIADAYGQATGDDPLHPNALCSGGGTFVSATVIWSGLGATLYVDNSKTAYYDKVALSGTWTATI